MSPELVGILGVGAALLSVQVTSLLAHSAWMRRELEAAEKRHAVLVSDLRSEVSDLRSEVTELRSEVTELRSEVADLRSEVAELRSEVDSLRSEVATLRSEVTELRSEVTELRSEGRGVDRRLARVEGVLAWRLTPHEWAEAGQTNPPPPAASSGE